MSTGELDQSHIAAHGARATPRFKEYEAHGMHHLDDAEGDLIEAVKTQTGEQYQMVVYVLSQEVTAASINSGAATATAHISEGGQVSI